MATICMDCGQKTKNRSKRTMRCWDCHKKIEKKNSHGRIIGKFCSCGKPLSAKKNSTGKCRNCFTKSHPQAWNKGIKGLIPWNKGISIFKTDEDRIESRRSHRMIRYYKFTARQKMAERIRCLIRNSMRYRGPHKKNSHTVDILGCSIDFFILYIEQQFQEGMNWENYGNGYGKWNIDHIIPISSFNLETIEQQRLAFNFKNCQPMWAMENIKKGGIRLACLRLQ